MDVGEMKGKDKVKDSGVQGEVPDDEWASALNGVQNQKQHDIWLLTL